MDSAVLELSLLTRIHMLKPKLCPRRSHPGLPYLELMWFTVGIPNESNPFLWYSTTLSEAALGFFP